MTYEQIKDLTPGDFKRACGVLPQTFEQMRQVLQEHAQRRANPDAQASSRWRTSAY